MEERKKILILVVTEYHLMLAMAVYLEHYSGFNVTVLHVGSKDGLRFGEQVDHKYLKWEYKRYELTDSGIQKLKQELKNFISQYDLFISFWPRNFVSFFITDYFRKNKLSVWVGQDGLDFYIHFARLLPRARLVETVNMYKKLYKNGLWVWRFVFFSYNKIKPSLADGVWVTHPSSFEKAKDLPLKEIKLQRNLTKIKRAFCFNYPDYLPKENVAFYINHPDEKITVAEEALIRHLKSYHPEKKIIIKLHPGTKETQIKTYKDLGCLVIATKFAAEFYISELKESLILSIRSTAAITNNPGCKFYWLYPFIQNQYKWRSFEKIETNFSHIHVVHNLNEID